MTVSEETYDGTKERIINRSSVVPKTSDEGDMKGDAGAAVSCLPNHELKERARP